MNKAGKTEVAKQIIAASAAASTRYDEAELMYLRKCIENLNTIQAQLNKVLQEEAAASQEACCCNLL